MVCPEVQDKQCSLGKQRQDLQWKQKRVVFDDVAGVNEAKQDLQEVVTFLKKPEKFTSVGARIPKGVLLVGPPGTGKTLWQKQLQVKQVFHFLFIRF